MSERIPSWARKPPQSCRTCAYWDKPKSKRALSGYVFPCIAPLPEMKLPESITRSLGFDRLFNRRKYMGRDEGKSCPAWTRATES